MKYLCLVYLEEKSLEAMPEAQLKALYSECVANDEALRQSGHGLASGVLESARTARTLPVRSGKVLVTDGPFAETKEQLGGCYVVVRPGSFLGRRAR